MTSRQGALTIGGPPTQPYGTLPWLPPARHHGGPLGLVDAGEHWDAVRATGDVAEQAIETLAQQPAETSALLHDPRTDRFYWLVPAGYAHAVANGLPGVLALGTGSHVQLAHADERDGVLPHWIVPPEPGRWITDPAALRAALATTTGIELPRLRVLPALGRLLPAQVDGAACIWCEQSVDETAVPYPAQPRRTSNITRWYPRSCPRCAW